MIALSTAATTFRDVGTRAGLLGPTRGALVTELTRLRENPPPTSMSSP
jgi:hypothetical protein